MPSRHGHDADSGTSRFDECSGRHTFCRLLLHAQRREFLTEARRTLNLNCSTCVEKKNRSHVAKLRAPSGNLVCQSSAIGMHLDLCNVTPAQPECELEAILPFSPSLWVPGPMSMPQTRLGGLPPC